MLHFWYRKWEKYNSNQRGEEESEDELMVNRSTYRIHKSLSLTHTHNLSICPYPSPLHYVFLLFWFVSNFSLAGFYSKSLSLSFFISLYWPQLLWHYTPQGILNNITKLFQEKQITWYPKDPKFNCEHLKIHTLLLYYELAYLCAWACTIHPATTAASLFLFAPS